MIRFLFLAHRYVGIALGLVVTLWCLSGFVMMYVQYPRLDAGEQAAGLARLDLDDCCRMPNVLGNLALDRFRLEMLTGRPVMRLFHGRAQTVVDLQAGEVLGDVEPAQARAIAASAAQAYGLEGALTLEGAIERDQWTVYGSYHPHRPLYHFTVEDPPGTEFYISSTTGEVVQMTTANVRFWNWIGSVVHWLYPTVLRQHTAVWVQTVIWLTIVSLFLTVVGIYIAIRQFRFRRKGRKSPYRGWVLWHHYAGLLFGLFTLTWLVSGLFSMNPWGALEGRSFALEDQRLRGGELDLDRTRTLARSISGGVMSGAVRIDGAMVGGELTLVATTAEGGRTRLASDLRTVDALPERFFAAAPASMRPDVPVRQSGWLHEGDAYYFSHHAKRRFPVYRIEYEDGERLYLDSVSGELAFAVDSERQWMRWVFHALHRGDFSALFRSRPLWDLMMWPLLLGVTVGSLTGTWIGIRRVVRWAAKPRRNPFNAVPELQGKRSREQRIEA